MKECLIDEDILSDSTILEKTKKNRNRIIRIAKLFQALTYWPIYSLLRFFVHFKIYGQENLKGLENKAVIFASNHTSFIDGPISAAVMPRRKGEFYPRRFFPIRFLALGKFFKWRYFPINLYVWINGSVKVWPGTGRDLGIVLHDAIEVLNNNGHLWIFPEGKMTKDGQLGKGRRGITYLHRATGAPIMPVAIRGTFGILSWKTFLRTKKITVNIGKPIYALENMSLKQGAAKVMQKIKNLLEERKDDNE